MLHEDDAALAVGRVARLTGVSPDLLRAWERRYGAIEPLRSPGGTRRYRADDVARVRLLKAAVESGFRIGEVAGLSTVELEAQLNRREEPQSSPLEQTFDALERLAATEAEQLVSAQLAALGPAQFATAFALPLLRALGEGWERRSLCISSEHLGSALLRSALGSALRTSSVQRGGPLVIFATLPGERHELGLLIAAIAALGAGARPLYLGLELPVDELARAALATRAAAVALSAIAIPAETLRPALESLRAQLERRVELWVGGAAAGAMPLPARVHQIRTPQQLDQRIELLREAARL